MAADDITAVRVLLTEYEALKAEQCSRTQHRDAVSIVEAVLLVGLGIFITAHADLCPRRSQANDPATNQEVTA